jgi:phospholipid N-methyltransferase
MSNTLKTHLQFLWAALLKQPQTGSIIPSQRFLINRMIAPVPEDYSGRVIELGAGSGALTHRLAERCPGAQILACEINHSLARVNRSSLAAAGIDATRVKVVADSAENLLSKLGHDGSDKADFIISGIPIGNFPRERALTIVEAVKETLRPGGLYIQFQYFLADHAKIRKRFARMRTIPVLLNFPPAFVYYAQKSAGSD